MQQPKTIKEWNQIAKQKNAEADKVKDPAIKEVGLPKLTSGVGTESVTVEQSDAKPEGESIEREITNRAIALNQSKVLLDISLTQSKPGPS